MTFAAEARHDPAAIRTFETIALGLAPLVAPRVAAEVRALLAEVPDVPGSVLASLERRAGGLAAEADEIDVASGSGHDVRLLVETARLRPSLARDLLARDDISVFDRAVLYRQADEPGRDALRAELAERLAVVPPPRPLSGPERSVLAVLGEAAGFAATVAQVAHHLGHGITPDWRPHRPLDAEMFALALVALGLDAETSIRVFLTIDPEISRSVRSVFRLGAVVRATAPVVASYLVASDLGAADATARTSAAAAADPRTLPAPVGQRTAVASGSVTQAREPDRSEPFRHGYRSRSTISRGRS